MRIKGCRGEQLGPGQASGCREDARGREGSQEDRRPPGRGQQNRCVWETGGRGGPGLRGTRRDLSSPRPSPPPPRRVSRDHLQGTPAPSRYLEARVAQHLQGGPHVRLQLVLHPRQAQQLHLPLQALHHGGHLERPVVDAQLGLVVAVLRTGGRCCDSRRAGRGGDTRGAAPVRTVSPRPRPLTSKSWYCSSVSALLATTRVRRPSRAMLPHWKREAGHTRPGRPAASATATCSHGHVLC